MTDLIVMPPVPGCDCALCIKRDMELQLASEIEREWYEAASRDMARRESEYEAAHRCPRRHERRQSARVTAPAAERRAPRARPGR